MPTSRRGGDNKGSRKGKNVSTTTDDDADADTEEDVDDDDASTLLAVSHMPARAITHSPSPPNACADADLGLSGRSSLSHSSLDEAKIGEYMLYIEQLDDLERHDPERVDFTEFPDTSRRIRHTSYNTNAADRDLDGVVVNQGDELLLERVNSQEQKLKLIQAQIEKINSSLTPVTRDLLSVDRQVVSSSTFIQRESMVETITTIYTQPQTGTQEIVGGEEVKAIDSSPKRYVTLENISLLGTSDETTPNLTPMTAASDSVIATGFNLRPQIQRMTSEGNVPLRSASFIRTDSFDSAESAHFYRQQSSSSGVSTILDREAELEYIRGRDDWKDLRRGSHIYDAIDSDNYHHHRRYSEVDDTLEYIRGRDEWKQRHVEQDRQHLDSVEVHNTSAFANVSIRDQIDSDEYHHARRLSECLDLAFTNRNVRFIEQELARNRRSRSPFRVLRSDMDRNEFLDSYYVRGSDEFERAVSESRDVAEDRMISNERLGWSRTSAHTQLSTVPPAPIHILIEDTSVQGTENELETWEEVDVAEFAEEVHSSEHSQTSSGWDLEQSYDAEDAIAEVTPEIQEPTVLPISEASRRRAECVVHQNTLAEEDTEADQEVAGILNVPKPIVMDLLKESSAERSASDLSGEEDEQGGAASLKKSKTTRNLLLAERLSVDLSSNEPALKAIAAKSDEMKRTKSGAISSFLEQERKNEEHQTAVSVSTPSNTTGSPIKPVKIVTMSEKIAEQQKSKVQLRPDAPSTHENMDDLMLETSMGPWFHK